MTFGDHGLYVGDAGMAIVGITVIAKFMFRCIEPQAERNVTKDPPLIHGNQS